MRISTLLGIAALLHGCAGTGRDVPLGEDAGCTTEACATESRDGGANADCDIDLPRPECAQADAPCESSTCDWPDEWQRLEREVLDLVNEARGEGAICGGVNQPPAPPLAWDDWLADAARLHAMDMAEQGYFDHTSLDGRSPWDRILAAGYTGQPGAENIAAGSTTAAQVMNNWMSSPGHCRNIMAGDLTEMGVGYANLPGSTWGHYWVQTFGRR